MNDNFLEQKFDRGIIDILSKAIAAETENSKLVELYIERARNNKILGEDIKSVEDYFKALEIAEDETAIVHIRSMIALALVGKGQKDQAIYWSLETAEKNPHNSEGHYILGLICDYCEFYTFAIQSFRRAIDLQPNHWKAMLKLGKCLREVSCLQESVEVLSSYVKNNPHDPRGLYELGWTTHVSFGIENGLEKARELYDRARNQKPSLELRKMIDEKMNDLDQINNR